MTKKLFFIVVLLIGVIVVYVNYRTIVNGMSFLSQLFFTKTITLKKTDNNINVLLLGIGGGTHEGPDLTDTIIFANIEPSKKEINLISIPRDIWIPAFEAKINSAYSTGEEKDHKGILTVATTVENVTGKKIDYTVVGDFSGFKSLVDLLGGVDVEVKNTFDDYEYPITGAEQDLCGHSEDELPLLSTASSQLEVFPCRYQHVHFEKGTQHMDGATALIYVRSRHALSDEGSDFARSARQSQVILATKSKALSLGTFSNPIRVIGIYNVIKDNIKTDIDTSEFDDFIRLGNNMKDAKITHYAIDAGSEKEKKPGLLVNPILSDQYKYQWVLVPRIGEGDFSEIHSYVDCIVQGKMCEVKEEGISIVEKK